MTEDEGRPFLARQACQCVVQLPAQLRVENLPVRGGPGVRLQIRRRVLVNRVPSLPLTAEPDGLVHRDAVEPRGEVAVHAEPGQPMEGGQQRLLVYVLRVGDVADHITSQRQDGPVVATHQLLESPAIPLLRATDPVALCLFHAPSCCPVVSEG